MAGVLFVIHLGRLWELSISYPPMPPGFMRGRLENFGEIYLIGTT